MKGKGQGRLTDCDCVYVPHLLHTPLRGNFQEMCAEAMKETLAGRREKARAGERRRKQVS